MKEQKFELKEETHTGKKVFLIYGEKGVGKTTLAMMFPGNISVLSFDKKSLHAKVNMHKGDPRIKVYNAVEYLSQDPEEYTESSKQTYDYIKFLLEEIKEKDKPEYILLDGMEIISKIAEMTMRFNHKLEPFQGITNRNVWKERRLIIRDIHDLALKAAKKGVIYTTYTEEDKIVIEGSIETLKKVPKWIDVVMWETDVVFRVFQDYNKNKELKIFTRVETSKFDKLFETGKIYDITRVKNIAELIKK